MKSDITISIVGLGLIGGSIGMALKKSGFSKVYGIDINEEIIEFAEKNKIIDRGFLNIEEPLSKSDIVFICIYPKQTVDFIMNNKNYFKPNAIVTDVAGIKTPLIESLFDIDLNFDFIPGHPMAGKEEGGIYNADDTIFKNANYILVPTDKNKDKNLEKLKSIIKDMGFGNILLTDSFTHDENITYVSQLPHILAVSMINCKNVDEVEKFAGGSYKDITRVARINSELWSELFIENKRFLLNQIDLFMEYIDSLKNRIENEDRSELIKMLDESFNKKGELLDEKA